MQRRTRLEIRIDYKDTGLLHLVPRCLRIARLRFSTACNKILSDGYRGQNNPDAVALKMIDFIFDTRT